MTQRHEERAFTMVELLIVMAVISIIMAIVIPTFFSMRKRGEQADFISSARSYQLAIEAYKMDHASKVPVIGTADWPTGPDPANPRVDKSVRGPLNNTPGLNLSPSKVRYLKGALSDSLMEGTAKIDTTRATATVFHIQYLTLPNGIDYTLIVSMKDKECYIGSTPPAGTMRFANPKDCERL